MRPDETHNASFYASSSDYLEDRIIPISYTLFDAEADPIGQLSVFYSLTGGGDWQPAIATSNTSTTHLDTLAAGVTYVYHWDTFASGFFGQSDNVVLRFVARSQPATGVTHDYTHKVPTTNQRPFASTTTFPFRVRGTQVQITSTEPVSLAGATVYRLSAGQNDGGPLPLSNPAGESYRTNHLGFFGRAWTNQPR